MFAGNRTHTSTLGAVASHTNFRDGQTLMNQRKRCRAASDDAFLTVMYALCTDQNCSSGHLALRVDGSTRERRRIYTVPESGRTSLQGPKVVVHKRNFGRPSRWRNRAPAQSALLKLNRYIHHRAARATTIIAATTKTNLIQPSWADRAHAPMTTCCAFHNDIETRSFQDFVDPAMLPLGPRASSVHGVHSETVGVDLYEHESADR